MIKSLGDLLIPVGYCVPITIRGFNAVNIK